MFISAVWVCLPGVTAILLAFISVKILCDTCSLFKDDVLNFSLRKWQPSA